MDESEEGVPIVSREVFEAMLTVNVDALEMSEMNLRPVLASLVRMSLISSSDHSANDDGKKTRVLRVLSEIELVNNIVALLSVDFPALEAEIKKEQSLKAKGGVSSLDSAIDFETSDATGRLRLVLKELLLSDRSTCSELFDHVVYLSEICDVLCIALAELPHLLSAPEVAEALLKLKYGPFIITHIVANQPDSFGEVTNYLLKNGEKQDEDPFRMKALLYLCRMNPSQALTVRNLCVEYCRLPGLAIMLTLENESDDLVPFVSGLLLGSDASARNWISLFIRNKRRNTALAALRKRLLCKLTDSIESGLKTSRNLVQASALLRLYTALRGIGGLKFSDEEIDLLLSLITKIVPKIPAGFKFVTLGLCMIIACNSLISTPTLEKRALTWLRWLVDDFESKAGNVEEMLFLLAIHFHSQQFSAVSELACATLGMKIAIRNNNMTRIKHIFTQEVFTENVVAAHAIKVPVTDKLSAENTGFLPVHCIHQLLKSRAFSKHKVPIKDWIYRQICASKTPLHPVMPALIEVYVNSILVPASNRGGGSANLVDQTNEPITEKEVSDVFTALKTSSENGDKGFNDDYFAASRLAPQMLMLYYVLLYDGVRLSCMKSIISSNRKILRYSQKLFAELPLKFLLRTAEKKQKFFGGLFPPLLRLCSTHYPHLCSVNDWLEADVIELSTSLSTSQSPLSESDVSEAFSEINVSPVKATLVLQRLLELPARNLWPFAQVYVKQIKTLLEPGVPRQILDLFKRLWFKLNTIFPRKLWVFTVNAMKTDLKTITQDELIFDPLHVLRVDKRVFGIAPILEIIIYLLRAALAASRTHLTQHIQNNPIIERYPQSQVSNDQEREELKMALVITQESAAVQILLEAAALRREESERIEGGLTDIKEIQCLVCSYLHEAFINDPHLAKLVHFQGYPLELLPVTVAGVPSMHICLDFAPELLSQPSIEKQVFAVDLISHLSVHYAIPKSYSIARLAMNALSTLLSVVTEEDRGYLFPPVLPSFVRFCKAFPPLTEDALNLLLQYGRVVGNESRMKGYSLPPGVQDCPEEKTKCIVEDPSRVPPSHHQLLILKIRETFSEILQNSLLDKRIF